MITLNRLFHLSSLLLLLLGARLWAGPLTSVATFTGATGVLPGSSPHESMVNAGAGFLWGTTNQGGAANLGTVFKVEVATGVVTTVLEFTGTAGANKGSLPFGAPVSDGAGLLWGTTQAGGANGGGTIYKLDPGTGTLTTVVEFDPTAMNGSAPETALVYDGAGYLWGTTVNGGTGGHGTVFKVQASTGTLTKLADFTGTSGPARGDNARGTLVSDGAGFFWGTTTSGGTQGLGTVFKVDMSSGTLTAVVDFTGTSGVAKGSFPFAGLTYDGAGQLWGTTAFGGLAGPGGAVSGLGTVFKVDAGTGTLTTVVQFTGKTGTKGSVPEGVLVDDGAGSWLGTTETGGLTGNGTIFKLKRSTGALTTVVEFTGNRGAAVGVLPQGGLVRDDAGTFWGTTGGASGMFPGSVYKLAVSVPPPVVQPPVLDTTTGVTGAPGLTFSSFGQPVIDGGMVGGLAQVKATKAAPQAAIYAADGSVRVQVGGLDPVGGKFMALGDPVTGGGGLGFLATTELVPAVSLPLLGPTPRVTPGGRVAALYSQLGAAAALKRLAYQTQTAPGTNGQFAKFTDFALPRQRAGLVFTATLHRGGEVTGKNDFGVWREQAGGGESDLVLRNGTEVLLGDGSVRMIEKLTLLTKEAGSIDQRRSFAPDGGLMAAATFGDGKRGLVRVAADLTKDVPVDTETPVPRFTGMVFESFGAPATANGGDFAFLAKLKAAPSASLSARGLEPHANVGLPPTQGIFVQTGATLSSVLHRGDPAPGGGLVNGLGTPAVGQRGALGTLITMVGLRVSAVNNKAFVFVEGGTKTMVARLGDQAPGYDPGSVYKRFLAMVVTDSTPARLVFNALVGGPGVKAGTNLGLWSYSTASGAKLLLRLGGPVTIDGKEVTVRSFQVLVAPTKGVGQGRSTDEAGFVTAKARLSDGRTGVLRIPLP